MNLTAQELRAIYYANIYTREHLITEYNQNVINKILEAGSHLGIAWHTHPSEEHWTPIANYIEEKDTRTR